MNNEESEDRLQDKVREEDIHRHGRVSHRPPHLQPQVLAVQEEERATASHQVAPEIGGNSSYCRGEKEKEQEPKHSPWDLCTDESHAEEAQKEDTLAKSPDGE